jgi:hypothetical protein
MTLIPCRVIERQRPQRVGRPSPEEGRPTQDTPAFAEWLQSRGAGLRVLNLGRADVDTHTPMGSMLFTVMAALAQMELEIKCERITDSVAKRRAAGKDLGGRRQTFTDSQIRNALRLLEGGEPATQVARDVPGHLLPPHPGASSGCRLRRFRAACSLPLPGRLCRTWSAPRANFEACYTGGEVVARDCSRGARLGRGRPDPQAMGDESHCRQLSPGLLLPLRWPEAVPGEERVECQALRTGFQLLALGGSACCRL